MVHLVQLQREMQQMLFFWDGTVRDALEVTTLINSEKSKKDPTTEMLQIHYKYVHKPLNRLQAVATKRSTTKEFGQCYSSYLFSLPICQVNQTTS